MNGSLLDSVDAVIKYAKSMVWKGSHPVVELVTTAYETGIKLTEDAMQALEAHFERFPSLDKWFVDIHVPHHDQQTPFPSDPLPFSLAA